MSEYQAKIVADKDSSVTLDDDNDEVQVITFIAHSVSRKHQFKSVELVSYNKRMISLT